MENILEIFWSHKFWLSSTVSWDDFQSNDPSIYYPRVEDLVHVVYTAICITIIRFFIEQYLWKPIGISHGLKDRKANDLIIKKYPYLEQYFAKHRKQPNDAELKAFSKKYELSERQIQKWFHQRKQIGKASPLVKFHESGWRFVYFFVAFCYGAYVLHDKPWLWDSREYWRNHPRLHVPNCVFWYYMIECGYYLSSAIFAFVDVKRKDFVEMQLHHVITLMLMACSWVCNYVRVGVVILILHDAADYWMELAKMAGYIKQMKWANRLFIMFVVVWIPTRLMIYPFWCIRSVLFDISADFVGPVYYVFATLLLSLQGLHFIWTYYIWKIVKLAITGNEIQDTRSDSDDCEQINHVNGNGSVA